MGKKETSEEVGIKINPNETKLFTGIEYAELVGLNNRDIFVISKKWPKETKTFKEWTKLLTFENLPVIISNNLKILFNL